MAQRVAEELDTRAFLSGVQAAAGPRLAAEGLAPSWQQRFSFTQAAFGARGIHYEAWLQRNRSQVEVGLHLEAGADLNGWLLCRLGERWPALWHALGPEFELEQWTSSWGRVHALLPFTTVDEALVVTTAERLAQCVLTLEPVVAELLRQRRA